MGDGMRIIYFSLLRIKILFQNRTLFIISLIIPFIFFNAVGFVFRNSDEFTKIPITIIDEDNTDVSGRIVENISKNELLKIVHVSKEDAFKLLYDNRIEAIYVLKDNLKENILKEDIHNIIDIYYLEESIAGAALGDIVASEVLPEIGDIKTANKFENICKRYNITKYQDPFEQSLKYSDNLWKIERFDLPINIEITVPKTEKQGRLTIDEGILPKQSALGMSLVFTTIYLIFCSTSIVKEKNSNVYKRLKVSGYNTFQLSIGNMAGIIGVGMILLLIQFISLISFFNITDFSLIFQVIIIYLFFTLAISNLVLFFTNIFNNQIVLQSFAPLFVILLGLLGGSFWSIELYPENLQSLARLTPTYWGLDALVDSLIFNLPFSEITYNLIILFAIGIILFLINFVLASIRKY